MNGILLDGVTGAGKSQTLAALEKHPKFAALLGNGRVFMEEETLGEVMDELTEPNVPPSQHLWRLENVMAELTHAPRLRRTTRMGTCWSAFIFRITRCCPNGTSIKR